MTMTPAIFLDLYSNKVDEDMSPKIFGVQTFSNPFSLGKFWRVKFWRLQTNSPNPPDLRYKVYGTAQR